MGNQLIYGKTSGGLETPVLVASDGTVQTSGGGGGGGGTQYADGATAATPTGNQINWNSSGTQRSVSTTYPLPTQEIGTAITGQSLESGGVAAIGWLSSLRKAITDRLPSALTGSGNLKVAISEASATVTASVSLPSTIYNGKKTVTTAGTRVTLAASQAITSGVTIKALITNTGLIYVGDSSVSSTNGYQLSAGDTVFLEVANLNTVNLDAAVNGEGVTYLAS